MSFISLYHVPHTITGPVHVTMKLRPLSDFSSCQFCQWSRNQNNVIFSTLIQEIRLRSKFLFCLLSWDMLHKTVEGSHVLQSLPPGSPARRACISSLQEPAFLFFAYCTQVAWGPASKVTMEFEENTIETNCLCLLRNLLARATMSRGCHRRENKLPKGAGWEMTD